MRKSNAIYDVIIVGTGPAGMFAALELVKLKPGIKIVMFEKGPIRKRGDKNRTSGWGGSGAFSDGKLDFSSRVGGQLASITGEEAFQGLMNYTDSVYRELGDDSQTNKIDDSKVDELKRKALSVDLELIPFPVRHIGTEKIYEIAENMRKFLEKSGVEIFVKREVKDIRKFSGFLGVSFGKNSKKIIKAKKLIIAPGRDGAEWLAHQAKKLGLKLKSGGVDIGVRVETKAETLKHLTDLLHEFKIIYYSKTFDDKVRTFCVCPYGFVTLENHGELTTVNGHSYKDVKSQNSNFAILVTQYFTKPFKDSIGYGRAVAQLANLIGKTVVVQRLGDLKNGRRSTPEKLKRGVIPTLKEATPGDVSLVIPHRQLTGILEMLEALESIAPGISGKHTLLYGAEVKFYSNQIKTGKNFETKIDGLYVAGDGSGYTRGLLQASIHGVIVARDIANKVSPTPNEH